jgi:hypothetical protein
MGHGQSTTARRVTPASYLMATTNPTAGISPSQLLDDVSSDEDDRDGGPFSDATATPPRVLRPPGTRRARPDKGPPTPDFFELRDGSRPRELAPPVLRCEELCGRSDVYSHYDYPSRKEVASYAKNVVRWLHSLPWFQEQTLEAAERIFRGCVDDNLLVTYFSMRLVALSALFLAAKLHEPVESIKLKEIVGLTEDVTAKDVRAVEIALLECIDWNVLRASQGGLEGPLAVTVTPALSKKEPLSPTTPAGVEGLVIRVD